MSRINGEKARGNITARRRTAMREKLRLAKSKPEQTGAMQMYRGIYAYYRNGTGHRLREDFDPNEALRIVAWVDHLLGLLD